MTNRGNIEPAVEDRLVELVDQIDEGDFKDGRGHDAKRLEPFVEAKSFLEHEVGIDVHQRARELQGGVRTAYERSERVEVEPDADETPAEAAGDAGEDLGR